MTHPLSASVGKAARSESEITKNLFIAVLVAVACGCNESVTGPSSNLPFIRGRVVDFSTQIGVSGVVVQFGGNSPLGSFSTTTDANGFYAMSVPILDPLAITVDGAHAGVARVNGQAYRGDLMIDRGTCISRYGTIFDARTLKPVAGATVRLSGGSATAISGADGWYRIDVGCPSMLRPGNTTNLNVTHPSYAPRYVPVGRGVYDVLRLDLDLKRE